MTKTPEVKKPAFPGKRAAVPPSTITIQPNAFPGARYALAGLSGKPIRNEKRRGK